MDRADADRTRSMRVLEQDGVAKRRLRTFRLRGRAQVHVVTKPIVRAGARAGCDILIDDESVSRLHFEIEADNLGYRLRDLGSKNGTFVDGYRVGDIYLRPGSVIRAGGVVLCFDLGADEVDVAASSGDRFGPLVGRSLKMRELFATLERAARSDATILIEGESGTGKELFARAVHDASSRARGPFAIVDCAAIPANLFESELFVHERSAFTGAAERRIGCLEEASGGTLFLDELGELPLELQPKLLRALEAGRIRRVGGRRLIDVDLRVVAATNRDLAAEINRKAFRDDLYYRPAVVRIRVPALRERPEDIPPLVEHLLRRALNEDIGRADRLLAGIGAETWAHLAANPRRGNVRELRNVLERALALSVPGDMRPLDLDAHASASPWPSPSFQSTAADLSAHDHAWEIDLSRPHAGLKPDWVQRFDRAYVLGQLARHGGNISQAARASGLERMRFKRTLSRCR